jgi:Zn-dependent protease
VSVALFAGLGALIWDPVFAAGLLLVVLVHELGHFAAMRAFGYRNTHILALPLVGGVAMGHDADPSATRRAWMSLMGPLPGILIGWGLLLAIVLGRLDASWAMSLATIFLLINYLNVLPMPPLDGAHVLEALLPARWARLQTVVIGACAVAGGLVAMYFGIYLLAVLAFFQLFALVGSWRLHGVERSLAGRASLALRPRRERIGQILGELDAKLGPTPQAATRVNQALQVAQRLEMKPMGALARISTGLVYVALLVVPVGAGIVWLLDASAAAPSGYDQAAMAARMAEQQTQQDAWRKEAKAMPLPALLRALSDVPGFDDSLKALPAPATPAQFDAAQARLGAPLPAQLRELYSLADGVPAAGIAPLAEVAKADESAIAQLAYDGNLYFNDDGGLVLPAASVHGWWHLGGDEEAPLFYLPTPPRELPGKHIVSLWLESPSTHADLRDFLEMRLVEQRQAADYDVRWKAARARATVALANTPTPALLAAWETPQAPLLARLIMAASGVGAEPGPASDADLRAAEARLGAKLPVELAAVLRVHDGFRPLQLRPAAELVRWPAFAATDPRRSTPWLPPGPAHGEGGEALALDSEAAIAHCVVVAGRDGKPERAGLAWAGLLWCPDGKPAAWVAPTSKRGYATLRDWLLPQAAHVRAAHYY